MSRRPTADIVADLSDGSDLWRIHSVRVGARVLREAADRLAEFDAENRQLHSLVERLEDTDNEIETGLRLKLATIDALRPPCPNPSHSIECPWTYNDGMESYIYRCSKSCGHPGDHRSNGTYPVGWDSDALGARLVICPDCVDGKVSIEQLAATWRAVHETNLAFATTDHHNAYDYLRAVKP